MGLYVMPEIALAATTTFDASSGKRRVQGEMKLSRLLKKKISGEKGM